MLKKQVRIAFSGSGFLAPAHAGAVCAFLESGYIIIEAAGTSGGSIIASALGAGFTEDQIKHLAFDQSFAGLLSLNVWSLLRKMGYSSGNKLLRMLSSLFGEMTFKETHIPLTIMSTNLNTRSSFAFDAESTPNIALSAACRASASVPVIYAPVRNLVPGALFVDGGECNNIPVDKLVKDKVWRVGVDIEDSSGKPVTGPLGYLSANINTGLAANENSRIAWAHYTGAAIVVVDASGFGFLNTALTTAQRKELFDRGYTAAMGAIKHREENPAQHSKGILHHNKYH